jgi:hypothetical protein
LTIGKFKKACLLWQILAGKGKKPQFSPVFRTVLGQEAEIPRQNGHFGRGVGEAARLTAVHRPPSGRRA